MQALICLLALLAGCATEVVKPSDVITPGDLADVAEQYCKDHPDLPCGHVWDCQSPNGAIEQCVLNSYPLDAVEQALGGSCTKASDPRFDGHPLCWWCCGAGCGAGCNSKGGCYCPPPPPVDAGVPDAPPTVDAITRKP